MNTDLRLVLNNNDPDDPPALIIEDECEQELAFMQAREALDVHAKERKNDAEKQTAVSIHAYYIDVFKEIIDHIAGTMLWHCDLLITTNNQTKASIIKQIMKRKRRQVPSLSSYNIGIAPNNGRNILTLARHGLKVRESHKFVLHLHTKKTADPEKIGAAWRHHLIETLCGSDKQIYTALNLLENAKTGTLIPCRFKGIAHHYNWGGNYTLSRELIKCFSTHDAGVELSPDSLLAFPAGMMFWFKPNALEGFFRALLSKSDRFQEPLPYRCTLAHAAERLVCHACELHGFQWKLLANPERHQTFEKRDKNIQSSTHESATYNTLSGAPTSEWLLNPADMKISVLSTETVINVESDKMMNRALTFGSKALNASSIPSNNSIACNDRHHADINAYNDSKNSKHQKAKKRNRQKGKLRWMMRTIAYQLADNHPQAEWQSTISHARLEQALLIYRSMNRLRQTRYWSSMGLSLLSCNASSRIKSARIALWFLLGDMNWLGYSRAKKRIDSWKRHNPQLIHRLATYVTQTFSYHQAEEYHRWSKSASTCRISGGKASVESIINGQPEKLLFWHHYDRFGYLPELWFEVLREARRQGWDVVVSSNCLERQAELRLNEYGISCLKRANIGLCLTAYKDFTLLVEELSGHSEPLETIVFANDSVLPIQPAANIVAIFEEWHRLNQRIQRPCMRGMTDSVQLGAYHVQTYCFSVNRLTLQHPDWYRFWLGFSPVGSKLELVKRGEIGLSQALLLTDSDISCRFGLIELLLRAPTAGNELRDLNIGDIRCVNPTIFAWKSLLSMDFPFIKKQALFETCEGVEPTRVALCELKQQLPTCDLNALSQDLSRLLQTRF